MIGNRSSYKSHCRDIGDCIITELQFFTQCVNNVDWLIDFIWCMVAILICSHYNYSCFFFIAQEHWRAEINQGKYIVFFRCLDKKVEGYILRSWSVIAVRKPDHRPLARFANCVTHMPWCKSGSRTRGGGENVPGIPGACITRNFTYLVIGPWKRHKRSARLSTSFERHDATNILFSYSKLMIAVYDISKFKSCYFRPLWIIKISESFPLLRLHVCISKWATWSHKMS